MQENDFEKHIKSIMEDFHLSPSGSVWEKVSRRLNNKRRRKTPFIFLVMIGLLTAGYFVFYVNEKHAQNSNHQANNISSNNIKTDSTFLNDSNNLTIQKSNIEKKQETSLSNNKINSTQHKKSLYAEKNGSMRVAIVPSHPEKRPVVNEDIPKQKQDDYINNSQQQLNPEPAKENNAATALNDETAYDSTVPVGQSKNTDEAEAAIIKDSSFTSNSPVKEDLVATPQNKTDSIAVSHVKKPPVYSYQPPKWQWGINAFYGRSNAIESLGDFNKSFPVAYATDPGNRNDTMFYNEHSYNTSDAYRFGAVVQRKIIKNGFLSAGLNYIHLSTKSDINKRVDSFYIVQNNSGATNNFSVNGYYQPGPSTAYSSNYNFIELPVYFEHDVLHVKQFSFSYSAGFSLRQLISSNAIIYNQNDNVYFSKDELLNKTQFQVMAGLSFKFNTGKNTAIYLGPQFSYSLSKLLKNENNSNYHLINYGLQAGLLFHKK